MARIHRRTIQKRPYDPANYDGVLTHVEPDTPENKAKWALQNITKIKASGGDGIPVELFQILKESAELNSICQHIWKTQQWPEDWKRSVFILIPKKGNAKQCSNYCTIALISHASKVMLQILQPRLQQYMKDLGKAEEPDIKQESSRKSSISALLIMSKPLTVWITRNCGKFLK